MIFFPAPLKEELVLSPAWYLDWKSASGEPRKSAQSAEFDAAFWFRVGSSFGYHDLDGNLHLSRNILYDVTLSDAGYINFSRIPQNLVLHDNRGRFRRSIGYPGYPIMEEEDQNLYILNSESTGLVKLTENDEEVWKAEFASLITSLCYSESGILLGFLNGTVRQYDNAGNMVYTTDVTGSRIATVYGCTLGSNGKHLAFIAGLEPQRLFHVQLLNKKIEVDQFELTSDFRREVYVCFTGMDRYVFFEEQGGIGILNLFTKKTGSLSIPGELIGMGESEGLGVLSVLAGNGRQKELLICDYTGALLHREAFECLDASVRHIEDHIILCCDAMIIRIDLKVE